MKALDLKKIKGAADPHPARQADEPSTPGKVDTGAEEGAQQGVPASEREPWGVVDQTTPSGLEIHYEAGPKRLYRVRGVFQDGARAGNVKYPWFEVPSVSEVLSVLEKGGLSWWGMKVGVEGVQSLLKQGLLTSEQFEKQTSDLVVQQLTAHRLTVNHVRDKAADRGTNVHSALEAWVETGITPNPEFFPENERGYVQGLVAFINDAHPHPLASEFMVASTDGYAGRFDLLANLDFAGQVVTKTYPKREDKRESVSGVWLLDLKTSKSVYTSYHLQLAAYNHAMTECGYGEADHTGVVRLTDDGRYELVKGKAQYEDFLAVLNCYRALQGLK